VSAPIYDEAAQHLIQRLMDTQWADNVKARLLLGTQDNEYRDRGKKRRLRSQEVLARYYADDLRRERRRLEDGE
jgi:polyphosphate kinase